MILVLALEVVARNVRLSRSVLSLGGAITNPSLDGDVFDNQSGGTAPNGTQVWTAVATLKCFRSGPRILAIVGVIVSILYSFTTPETPTAEFDGLPH